MPPKAQTDPTPRAHLTVGTGRGGPDRACAFARKDKKEKGNANGRQKSYNTGSGGRRRGRCAATPSCSRHPSPRATIPPFHRPPPPPTTYNHTAQWKRRETPNGNGVYQPPPTSYLPLPTPPSPHPLFLRPPPKQNSWPQYETRAASGWGVGGKKVGQERVVPPTRPPSHTINGSIAPHERASSHANVSTDTYTHTRKRIQQGIRRVGGEREGGGA